MNRESRQIRIVLLAIVSAGLAGLGAAPVLAQVPVDKNGNPIAPLGGGNADEEVTLLSAEALEELVGPVALYPDDLLAIVLPASTYPLQVVQAARFLERLEDDPSLKPDEEWDESITALLNYPEVVELMNDDIEWTWRLGEAVVAQQADVISAIEAFRDRAYAAGNLKSDEHQTVSNEDGVIEIEPANDDVIYVPYYEPERVVVYQPRPVYYYHPQPYPVYYYPYPYGYSFASDYFWGVTTAFTIGWLTDHLHVYHPSYWGHPYYGHHYHNHYYYRRPSLGYFNRYYVYGSHRYWNHRYRDGDYWRPRRHGGARPGYERSRAHYYRDRNRDDWRRDSSSKRSGDASHRVRSRDNDLSFARNRSDARDRVGVDDRRARIGSNTADRGRNSGDRVRTRDQNGSGSGASERNNIRFRPRDADRRRTRASDDQHRRSGTSASYAAPPHRSSASTNRREVPAMSTRPSTRTAADRNRTAAANNLRRHVAPSPSRQARAPSRSHSQPSAPPRVAPSRSAPPRNAAPPTAPRHTSAVSPKSARRSVSKPAARDTSRRSERRSRRR